MIAENDKVTRIYKYDEWLPWEQNASPMLLVLALNAGMQNLKDYFDNPLWTSVIIFENEQAQWLFRPKELKMLGQKMIDFLMCPPYRVAFMTGYEEEEKRLINKAQDIQFKKDLTELSNHDLIKLFNDYSQIYYNWYKYGWFCEPIQFQSQDLLIAFLEKEKDNKSVDMDMDTIKQSIFAVEEKTFAIEILEHILQCAKALADVLKNKEIANKIQAVDSENDYPSKAAQIIFDIFDDDGKNNGSIKFLIEKLAEHSKMFYWKQNNYFSTQFLTDRDILKELFASDKFDISDPISPIERELQDITDNKDKVLIIKHRLLEIFPSYERNLAVLAGLVGGLIDKRKKSIMIANAAFDCIIQEVANRTNTNLNNCRLLIPQELQYFLEAPDDYAERFVERNNLFVVYQGEFAMLDELFSDTNQENMVLDLNFNNFAMTEPFIAEGNYANNLLEQLNSRLNFMVSTEVTTFDKIQGISTYYDENQPILEGIVKIIRNPKSEYIEKDEILVAPSTTPDYMEAIRQCKAIISDWGGQTSHAAITSRELGKPCVIGTNYASQVFKTGDKIKIDFKNGTIEKIV